MQQFISRNNSSQSLTNSNDVTKTVQRALISQRMILQKQRLNNTRLNRINRINGRVNVPRPPLRLPQRPQNAIINQYEKLLVKPGHRLVIRLESTESFDVYYLKDARPDNRLFDHKYMQVKENIYVVVDSFASDLQLMIKRKASTSVTVNYDYFVDNSLNKYAIVIGISDYSKISDLNFCDEDATDWFNYLKNIGYQCIVLGDLHKQNYPQYNGLATEQNVRKYMQRIADIANDTSKFAFISSGHGSGDGTGNSFLCMYDFNGNPNGKYTDKEFYSDINKIKGQKFVFLDHCLSGGLLDELQTTNNCFATSTCSPSGFGWDVSKFKNGAWTYTFLQKTLQEKYNNENPTIQETFDWAKSIFKSTTNNTKERDQPMAVSTLINTATL